MIKGLKEKVENGIKNIAENGIEREELDTLYKLVDIHKDLANEEYSEGREEYGHDDKGTMQALEYMLEAGVDFFKKLKEDAGSQEEMQMIKHYAKKISEML